MEHQELFPEARKALTRCYRLLYRYGRETMAVKARSQAEQSADEASLRCSSANAVLLPIDPLARVRRYARLGRDHPGHPAGGRRPGAGRWTALVGPGDSR